LAWATEAPANPDLRVPSIVRLPEPPSVADDRALAAERADAREPRERDLGHPGVVLSSTSGSAIKRINGWREGPPVTVLCQSFDLLVGPSPSGKINFRMKKRILLCVAGCALLTQSIGRFKTTNQPSGLSNATASG